MKQQKSHSMKWKVIRVMLVCWLIPFSVVIGVFGIYMGSSHRENTVKSYSEQMDFMNKITVDRINQAVSDSRKASYDGEILKLREQYLNDKISFYDSQKGYLEYLSNQYQKDDIISGAILFLEEENNIQSSTIYNESAGGSYAQIKNYWDQDHENIMKLAEEIGTKIGFYVQQGNLYMVRNLLDSHYKIRGTLIFLLNKNYVFNGILQSSMIDNCVIEFNDQAYFGIKNSVTGEQWERIKKWQNNQDAMWRRGLLYVRNTAKGDTYQFSTYTKMNDEVLMFPFYGYPYLIIGLGVSFLLMLLQLLASFRKEITRPVQILSQGVSRIENGEFGYQIEEKMYNKEFAYLSDNINKMSGNLKLQINKIYEEEIALREARIMALQSNINPHFLNNTMEIINWQARLEGNDKVSNMIEALSTVLDAAMDRRKLPEVLLEEEMSYVNAYLYIMKERLGKKLKVEIHIPEILLSCLVPRLILQPVIENAIEHGVVPNGEGTVILKGRYDESFMYLEILNDGIMTEDDRDRIRRLLDPEYNASKEPSSNLGIANVNQRLRIMFGKPCGLSIDEKDGKVCALLQIPLRNFDNINQEITE